MASRIRQSWQTLVRELLGIDFGDRAFINALRAWLRQNPAGVSHQAADAIHQARGIELVLQCDPATLPISCSAAETFSMALREAEVPKAPAAYVDFINRLCWELAVFHREDDCCPVCQGDLELWTEGTTYFEVCELLDCCFDEHGTRVLHRPPGLKPANRDEVLKRYPNARLIAVQWT